MRMNRFDAVAAVIVIFNCNAAIQTQFVRAGMMLNKYWRRRVVAGVAAAVAQTGTFDSPFDRQFHLQSYFMIAPWAEFDPKIIQIQLILHNSWN